MNDVTGEETPGGSRPTRFTIGTYKDTAGRYFVRLAASTGEIMESNQRYDTLAEAEAQQDHLVRCLHALDEMTPEALQVVERFANGEAP